MLEKLKANPSSKAVHGVIDPKIGHVECAEADEDQPEDPDGRSDVEAGPGPDFRPQQTPQTKLQANGKKHERHAEVGNGLQRLAAALPEGVQDEAGNQEANQRWLPELLRKQSEEKRDRNE